MTDEGSYRYPLADHHADVLKTPTGMRLSDISREAVTAGKLTAEDARISRETLELQAQVADAADRGTLAANFRRAAELTALPEETILNIYNALRPNRSTRKELEKIIADLEGRWQAPRTATLVREALEVGEERGLLRVEDAPGGAAGAA